MLPHGGVRISKENKGKTLDMKKRIHPRNHKLTLRLTDAEYTAISICSRQKQQTMSEYIRSELFTSKDTKMSAACLAKALCQHNYLVGNMDLEKAQRARLSGWEEETWRCFV